MIACAEQDHDFARSSGNVRMTRLRFFAIKFAAEYTAASIAVCGTDSQTLETSGGLLSSAALASSSAETF